MFDKSLIHDTLNASFTPGHDVNFCSDLARRAGEIQFSLALLRVLARISKMPVQNSNLKNFARPDLATYLLQILIPAVFNSLVCQKGQFTL